MPVASTTPHPAPAYAAKSFKRGCTRGHGTRSGKCVLGLPGQCAMQDFNASLSNTSRLVSCNHIWFVDILKRSHLRSMQRHRHYPTCPYKIICIIMELHASMIVPISTSSQPSATWVGVIHDHPSSVL